jgi:acetyl-CoA acyltransferase 2
MACLTRGVFIVGAKRTPFGTFGGRLKDVDSIELGRIASVAALEQANLTPDLVDSVICGNINQMSSKNGPYIARHIGLKVGVKVETPCLTVNRLCGSGFQSVVNGSQEICLDDSDIVLAIGSENMSLSPFVQRNSRFGVKFTHAPTMECSLWSTLTDWHINTPMGVTAENLAKKYGLTRQEVDEFALLSQTRWKEANKSGKFKDEMAPVKLVERRKEVTMEVDEHPQETTMESLGKLRPSFEKEGVSTAGNSSGIGDGAGAIVLASEESVNKHKLKPLARVAGYGIVGCDPNIMGIGPVQAIRRVCDANGLSLEKDVGLVDVNEAFSAQFLSVAKELKLDMSKTNVNGGAIALAHPVGASGSRITANLVYEMERRKVKYAIGAACIGGGQGIAVLLERLS